MDIGRAIGVPFRDPEWMDRAVLAGVWYLVPFLGLVLAGYSLDYMRWVANGRELPLPDWSQFGRYWVRGLLVGIGALVYALPGIFLIAVGIFPFIPAIFSESGTAMMAALGSMCFVYAMAAIYLIAAYVFVGALVVHYAMSESFSAFFEVSEVWGKIRDNAAEYFTALGMTIVLGMAAGTLIGVAMGALSFLPFVGTLAGMFVAGVAYYLMMVMSAHLYGQYAAKAYGMPGLAPLPRPQAPLPPDAPGTSG